MNSKMARSAAARVETASAKRLTFPGGEEALHHGIVETNPDAAHGGSHTGLPTAAAEGQGRVLAPLVRVVNDRLRLALPQRHMERLG